MKRYIEYFFILLAFIFALVMSFLVWEKLRDIQQTTFIDLAKSFLRGKFYLLEPVHYSSWQDTAFFNGKYYVYFGPTLGILFIPLAALGFFNFPQQFLALVFGFINFLFLFKIARLLGVKKRDAFWLTFAFIFGSIYLLLSLVNISSYLTQIAAFTFINLALFEYLNKKRWLLIGTIFALSGMTRLTSYATIPFFLIEWWRTDRKIRSFFKFILPVVFSLLILALYNSLRFGSLLETGYRYNTTFPPQVREAIENYGFFSLRHIPTNIYFLLFKGPEPVRISETNYLLKYPFLRANEWGMGIFFTSPFLFYIFLVDFKKYKIAFSSLISCIIGILPALLYGGVGVWQFGYRYALEIYPFLFLILSLYFKEKMPIFAKIIIFYSVFFDTFLMGSIWGVYPF